MSDDHYQSRIPTANKTVISGCFNNEEFSEGASVISSHQDHQQQQQQQESVQQQPIPSSISSCNNAPDLLPTATTNSQTVAPVVAFIEKDVLEKQQQDKNIEEGRKGAALPETVTSAGDAIACANNNIINNDGSEEEDSRANDNNNNNNNNAIPSSVSSGSNINNTSGSDAVPNITASSTTTTTTTKPADPVAFMEQDFFKQEPSKEEGGGVGGGGKVVLPPQTITSISANIDDNNNNMTHLSTSSRRSSRRTRKQHPSDSNDRLPVKKTKKNINQQGGNDINNVFVRRTSPRRRNKKHRGESEEEGGGEQDHHKNATTTTMGSSNIETNNDHCRCQLCNNPCWKNKIYYKCGTVLSKYFPKSVNNPNPGWYRGTIRTHHLSSSASSNSDTGSASDPEYKEEADSSIEEENEQQSIILNEIHYEDGDVENMSQDSLKLHLMNGRKVKILDSSTMAAASNSEYHDLADDVPPTTSSERNKRNWLEIYGRLKEFKEGNGHCRVPKNYGPDPSLGYWVNRQRKTYKERRLGDDRVEKLDKIGFEWAIVTETPDQAWQEKYDRLIIFKADNGHCRVPQRYGPDPPLANWVMNQRKAYKERRLAEDRVEKLNKIGFEWDLGSKASDQIWQEKYDKLKRFKAENGNCRVPATYGPDPSLGYWVKTQRKFCREGRLAADRKKKLNKIGFEWAPVHTK